MRRLGWIAGLIVGGTAGAAGAQVAPTTASTPLPTILPTPAPAPRGALNLSLVPNAVGGRVERNARLSRTLSMRVTVENSGGSARDRVHSRITGQMVDFFPAGDHGFHLSAGTRVFNPRALGPSDVAMRGLLPSQRRLNLPGMKTSMRRAPAVTMGYTDRIDTDTSVGFEVGAMQGRAYNDVANVARQTRADRNQIGSPINPMVNLVIGHRF